jgi:hypothetical protein
MPQLGDAAVITQGICFGEELRLGSLRGLLRQGANFGRNGYSLAPNADSSTETSSSGNSALIEAA